MHLPALDERNSLNLTIHPAAHRYSIEGLNRAQTIQVDWQILAMDRPCNHRNRATGAWALTA
jgi:hypothetical protein